MVMDPRILHMSDIELETVRIIGGAPTPVISFDLHQLHCIRSSLTNAVVEGSEDDIRAVYYLFALQVRTVIVTLLLTVTTVTTVTAAGAHRPSRHTRYTRCTRYTRYSRHTRHMLLA